MTRQWTKRYRETLPWPCHQIYSDRYEHLEMGDWVNSAPPASLIQLPRSSLIMESASNRSPWTAHRSSNRTVNEWGLRAQWDCWCSGRATKTVHPAHACRCTRQRGDFKSLCQARPSPSQLVEMDRLLLAVIPCLTQHPTWRGRLQQASNLLLSKINRSKTRWTWSTARAYQTQRSHSQ